MIKNSNLSHYIFTIIVFFLIGLLFLGSNSARAVEGSTPPPCNTVGINAYLSQSSPYTVTSNSELLQVNVYVPTGAGFEVVEVDFFADEFPLGPAETVSGNFWTNPNFNSYALENGVYEYYAVIHTNKATQPNCISNVIDMLVDHDGGGTEPPETEDYELVLVVLPGRVWTGNPNTPADFQVRVKAVSTSSNTATYVTPDTIFSWELEGRGSIQGPTDTPFLSYWSGGTPGEGTLTVEAEYEGDVETASIDLIIDSVNTSGGNTYPDTSTDGDLDPTDDDYLQELEELEEDAQENGNASNSAVTPGDPVLESCIAKVLGTDRYEKLTQDGIRLRLDELKQVHSCFSVTKFVLPPSVTPVEAKKEVITALRDKAPITFEEPQEIKNETTKETEGLVFRGVGEPFQQILIYIFSEPLVLTTIADANGNWEYVLENPLEPGDHEAYVVVEEEDGEFSRTDGYTIAVAQVPISAANPNGLSLSLAENSNGLVVYLVISASLVVAAGAVVYASVKTHKLQKKLDATEPGGGQVGMGSMADSPVPDHPKEVKMTETPTEPQPPAQQPETSPAPQADNNPVEEKPIEPTDEPAQQ